MNELRNYPDYMERDAEQERAAALRANGYYLPVQPTDEQCALMREVYARRGREKAAAESARYHTLTARGRLAAEHADAAARAQLDASKETT